jgi:Domain of unknown function (DUF4252)
MNLSRIVLATVLVVSAVVILRAQPPQAAPREPVPQGIEALRQSASSKTELTLDHSMLVFASKLSPENDDLRRVIAGVSGVSVHSFRFSGRWSYDPEVLSEVKEGYSAAGWKHVMNKNEKDGGPSVTDLWVRLENNAISRVAILVARSSEVDLIEVAGSISPLDLSHLGGHFGIPKIEGGVMVPNTR